MSVAQRKDRVPEGGLVRCWGRGEMKAEAEAKPPGRRAGVNWGEWGRRVPGGTQQERGSEPL